METLSYILCSVVSASIATITTKFLVHRKQGHGYFITKQINEDEYTINVRIPNPVEQDLSSKKTILLTKETSHQ